MTSGGEGGERDDHTVLVGREGGGGGEGWSEWVSEKGGREFIL